MKNVFLGNAFSLQMLDTNIQSADLHIEKVDTLPDVNTMTSVVGHPDTAAVLGVACNRVSLKLHAGDVLYVAQLVGGRLPEGTTTLPEGFSFVYYKVELV